MKTNCELFVFGLKLNVNIYNHKGALNTMFSEELIIEFPVEKANTINLSECWSKPGVWIAYGKTDNDTEYTCLEIGETINIKKELDSDFKSITKGICEDGNKAKCFRLWSKTFIKKKNETRHPAKWRDIANSYNYICIKYVSNSETWDRQTRLAEEINIAIDLQALYFYPNNWLKQCKYIRQ